MSHDLSFWRYKSSLGKRADHQVVYEALSNGESVETVNTLPVDQIRERVGAVMSDRFTSLGDEAWEGEHGAFTIYTTPQFVRFDCYGMSGDDMNSLFEIMSDFDCPLYDSQIQTRFDGGGD